MVLRNKSSATPVSSANWQGLQAMSTDEIKNYIAQTLTVSFGANSDGTGAGELNITTNNSGSGTSIGTFVDTDRQEATGTHPATGAVDTVTYYAKQVSAAATESITNRPLKYDGGIREMTDGQIDTEILDYAINAMVSETSYTAGQYRLQGSAPSGGTWIARYTLTDVANGGNTTTYLWQKTAATSLSDSNLKPLKLIDTKDVKEMSSSEILQMLPNFRNRIIDSGIGTYKIQSSAPVSGTWVQMGDEFADTREQVTPENYVGNYVGSYAGTYAGSRTYSGNYAGGYSGSYANNFSGGYVGPANYSGTYTGNFTGNYSGTYAGSRNYAGNYAGNFSGNYVGNYSGSRNYAGNYAGTYSSNFSGNYIGAGYATGYVGYYSVYYGGYAGTAFAGNYISYFSGTFSGTYLGNFTGYYAGSRNYAGNYAGTYLGTYTGFFSGSRNYAANYVGNYSGTYAGNFTGSYAGTATYTGTYQGFFTGNYTGYYSGSRNYTGNYAGNYSGTYSGTYSGATVIVTKETVSTVKLWVRTA